MVIFEAMREDFRKIEVRILEHMDATRQIINELKSVTVELKNERYCSGKNITNYGANKFFTFKNETDTTQCFVDSP